MLVAGIMIAAAIAIAIGFVSLSQEASAAKESYREARVHYVIDGDTVIVSTSWRKVKIRLYSIDCPEDGQSWGDTAKYGLIKLIGGRHVRLEEHGSDCYGRMLATIYVWNKGRSEWMNVNERMVTLGHAWFMRHSCEHLSADRREKLSRLESWAKSKRVGLWKAAGAIPPWTWRREV
jgi:endonuclease YncB( thermonuclease family)